MDSDPNKSGSGDESDSGEDLQPNSESQAESSTDESHDPDTAIDSVDRQRSDVDPRSNDGTADSSEQTLDSLSGQDANAVSIPTSLPTVDDRVDLTCDSRPPNASGADAFSDQANTIQNSNDASGINTNRGREAANKIDATLVSVPNANAVVKDDDLQLNVAVPQPGLPSHIGRYEIKRLLGEGTFGKVYEARDPQLDRVVAVKVAKSIMGSTQVKRFLREARAAAKLRHPRIIPVYEYGQVGGENIIVYEFVAGETLKSYLRQQQSLPLAEAVEIVRLIAEGLNYAHEQGIIHRDMKPDNVLIDPSGKPHIADFGCARWIEDNTNLTIDGSILGTPKYMSPEQAGGRSNTADGRTDIWSIGVMLYEMVSGTKPFEGKLSDLLFAICNKDPKPLRKVQPDVPLDIETICSKCLAREPDARFVTAKMLADELGRYQRGEPIKSRRISMIQRTWMWANRNQTVAGLISTIVITMLIGTIVSATFAIQAYVEKQNREKADIKRADAQLNALTSVQASALPVIFDSLKEFQATILPTLYEKLNGIEPEVDRWQKDRSRLQMAILKLETDPAKQNQLADEMVADLLVVDSGDFVVARDCLQFRKTTFNEELWREANNLTDSSSSGKRFRAAAALALFDPSSPNWASAAPIVAGHLTSLNETEASKWLPSLEPIRELLKPGLKVAYENRTDDSDNTPERAAAIMASLFEDEVPFLVSLVPTASPQQIPYLTDALRRNQLDAVMQLQSGLEQGLFDETFGFTFAVQESNLVTALIQLGDQTRFKTMAAKTDLSVATELIERLGPAATPFETLAVQIGDWESADSGALSLGLLSLGQYKRNQILDAQKADLLPDLCSIFSMHPDSRVHSCARWLLQQWGFNQVLADLEQDLRRSQPDPNMNWHVDPMGNTFALFGPVGGFEMGLDESLATGSGIDAEEVVDEPMHRKSIPRRFGICIHEVTIGQFASYEQHFQAVLADRTKQIDLEINNLNNTTDHETKKKNAVLVNELARFKKILKIRTRNAELKLKKWVDLDTQIPIASVDFFEALAYCRWLTDQQRIEAGNLPTVEKILRISDQFPGVDFLSARAILEHKGYRLPTASEWEYACRGGTETVFPFGRTASQARNYAWFATNSDTRVHPVGRLKPGNTGLFDVVGNVNEWCFDWYREKLPATANVQSPKSYVDFGPEFEDHRSLYREYRGGSFSDEVRNVRSTKRFFDGPKQLYPKLGFRLARTYAPSTDLETQSATSGSD